MLRLEQLSSLYQLLASKPNLVADILTSPVSFRHEGCKDYPETLSSALRRLRVSLWNYFTNIDLNPLAIFKPGNARIITSPIENERSDLVRYLLDVHHLGFG